MGVFSGSRVWAGHFHAVIPELELPLVRKEKYQKRPGLFNWKCAGQVVFNRQAIFSSFPCRSAHTFMH